MFTLPLLTVWAPEAGLPTRLLLDGRHVAQRRRRTPLSVSA